MTSLDNLEKQLAFLKNSMENLDQPKVEEVQEPETQEKTRTTHISSIFETPLPPLPAPPDDTPESIKNIIINLIDATPLSISNSVQGYINKIHNELDIEKAKAATAAPAAPAGISTDAQAEIDAAIQDKEAAIQAKEDAIAAHKSDLNAIYTALAALTKPVEAAANLPGRTDFGPPVPETLQEGATGAGTS